jgi:hypothetical protein
MQIKCYFAAEWHRERGFVSVEFRVDGHRYLEHMALGRFGEFILDLDERITIGEWCIAYAPDANPEMVDEIQSYFRNVLAHIVNTLSDEAEGEGLTE